MRRLTLLSISWLVISGSAVHAVEPPLVAKAFMLLARRADENRSGFWVYKDADSAFNHGFPSGLFGALDRIAVNGACIEEPATPSACSTDLARLDRVRGTVIRIAFSPLHTGEFAGINFEEPEHWGSQPRGVGYDLTGATALSLRARSPNGARVQFGVGGRTTPFVTIPTTWTTLTFRLSDLNPPGNIRDVHLLFTVVTNDAHASAGAILFLDDVRYTPVPARQATVPSLPLSNETFGVVPRASAPFPFDQATRNLATVYEAAIAIQALIHRGTPADAVRARELTAALRYALAHDNHGDPLPVAADGSRGLHNGYEGGDLPLLNDAVPGLARAGDVRLAGFFAGTFCPPVGFCLLFDGTTGGNNAFPMLALLDAYEAFGDPRDLDAARTIGRWMAAQLMDRSSAGFGGYFLGYPDGGVPPPKPLLPGKSIENNADIFVAFARLARIESRLGRPAAATLATQRANAAGDFVMRMFDSTTGCFSAGTVPVGTPAMGGIGPFGERRGDEIVNAHPFLDSQSFTALALMGSPATATASTGAGRPNACSTASGSRFPL